MANKGSVSCSATISAEFAGGEGQRDIVLQNTGPNDVFVHWDTAEVDKGLLIASGETFSTKKDLPAIWRGSMDTGLTAICAAAETATLIWTA